MNRGRPLPRLHVVTDDAVLGRSDALDVARAVVRAGGSRVALHLRGPGTSGRRLHELAAALVGPAAEAGALLLINDRVDVALVVGADGAHLGARSPTVADARTVLGPEAVLGASAHSADEVGGLTREGADYTFLGTVFATPTHPGRPGCGPAGVRQAVAEAAGAPVVAIGGIGPDRVAGLRAAGAWGVAVLRGVWNAPDPARAVVEFLNEVDPVENGT